MLTARQIVRSLRFQFSRDTLAGMACDHARMAECHPGCGHFACPCGVSWDDGAESEPGVDDDS